MSTCTVTTSTGEELDVMSADILFPHIGNWSAHLSFVGSEEKVEGPCVLTVYDQDFTAYAIPEKSGDSEGRFYAMLIGGKGNLSTSISSKMYNYQISASLVISEILSEVGEVLSPTSSPSFLNKLLPSFTRLAGSASIQISRLVDVAGGVWRVLPDGSVFVGTDSFSTLNNFDYIVEYEDPTRGLVQLSANVSTILPGARFPISSYNSLSEQKIGCVRYLIEPDRSRTTVWFLGETVVTDALHEGLEAFIKEVMRGIDYLGIYPSEVVLQRADGTLDIIPDDPKIPPMTSVPYRTFHPSLKLKIPPKSRGNLVFEQGSPSGFAFVDFEAGQGGRKMSGVGDQVDLGFLVSVKNMTGAITSLTWNATAGDISLGPGNIKTGNPNFEFGMESS